MSTNEKPTVDLDQLAIIRGLLERQEQRQERQESKVDNIGSKVDLLDTRFRNLEATTENTRIETQRLAARMTLVEGDIRELKDKDTAIVRAQSDADLEQQAVVGGVIGHVARIEGALQELSARVGGQTATLTTFANALTPYMSEAAGVVKRNAWLVKVGLVLGGFVAGAVLAWVKGH